MSYHLGVDLGTTWTAAAVYRDGQATTAALGSRGDAVRSVVLVREDGSVLVGEPAERRGTTEPERVAREFKRRIGDTTPILIAGSPFSAEALTARLLTWVVEDVSAREGGPPDTTVVCHPANWGPYKIELLDQVIQLAGLDNARKITEPEAAAIHYSRQARVETGSVIAVYDLGGGTFDAAVLEKTSGGFEVLGDPTGIEHLGGIDFDAAVFGHVARVLDGRLEALDEDDPGAVTAVARLRADCVVAKESLSSDTDVSIPVMLPDLMTDVRLTRAEFEAMIRPSLSDSVEALRLSISSAGVGVDEVSTVLLVGGSSRIPIVAQLVGAELGRPVSVDTRPKLSIALGAAAFGAEPSAAAEAITVVSEDEPPAEPPGLEPAEPPAATPTERAPGTAAEAIGATAAALPAADGGGSSGWEPPPPPGAAPGASDDDGRRMRPLWMIGAPLLVIIVLAALAFGFLLGGGGDADAQEVLLEPITSVGRDPFTSPVTPLPGSNTGDADVDAVIADLNPAVGDPSGIDFDAQIPVGTEGAITNIAGSAPGLYGGTNLIDVCDRQQLVTFLMAEVDMGQAWAEVQGIEFDQIPQFVAGLTDVILPVDTRVTNHGFRDGSAYAINSVLQAGTAVLVDATGVPRVRCYCGNPLLPARPIPDATPVIAGDPWPNFTYGEAVVITPAAEQIEQFVIDDVTTSGLLARTPGSDPSTAAVIEEVEPVATSTTTSSTTSSTTTTTTTTTTRPEPTNITSSGAVGASSIFGASFVAPLSVDGSNATSWFSAGGGTAQYTWDLGGEAAFIDSISIIGNAGHATVDFRTGFGFDAVTVLVLDGDGDEVFRQDLGLEGTPDPDVFASPLVVGSSIVLDFRGGESDECGGFAELVVSGSPV